MSSVKKSAILIILILLIDQSLKFWIKTNMYLGQNISIISDWFIIHFTENNGMAFGLEFGGQTGKFILSIFRIVAVFGIGWYILNLARNKAPIGVILSISLIFAGALGNIIDSAFYGMIFNESSYKAATFMPESGGYSGFLQGKVVDMFYFPIIDTTYADWFPIPSWRGQRMIFFRPVFNVADSAITIGVFIMILFQRKFLQSELKPDSKKNIPLSTQAE